MVSAVSRQGRHTQVYENGRRLVVGCIPYRTDGKSLEVLVISSQKGQGILFPKGGWENDETKEQSARREAFEEAGVRGKLGDILGKWKYTSRRYGSVYEGIMYPLKVTEVEGQWPEKAVRKRKWVTAAEAKDGCRHSWMKEALDTLVRKLSVPETQEITSK